MRHPLLVSLMLVGPAFVAPAQVSIGINLPGLSIGINQPVYPDLLPVAYSPVYYAPEAAGNYFFFDGLYWVYQGDQWYSSVWFNGPWGAIGSNDVPVFLLRVPVGYYRHPPSYFGGWDRQAPPRWGEHWGPGWEQRRTGWDHWDHAAPVRAPLPDYQRQYSGDRYPRADQQVVLHSQNYHYQPKEAVVRERYQQEIARSAAPAGAQPRTGEPQQQAFRPAAAPQPPPPAPGVRPGNHAPPLAQPPQAAPPLPPHAGTPQPPHAAPPEPVHAAPAQPPHAAPQPPVHEAPGREPPQSRKPLPGPESAPQQPPGNAPRPGNAGPPSAPRPQAEPPQQRGQPSQHGNPDPGQGRPSQGRGGPSELKHGQGSD